MSDIVNHTRADGANWLNKAAALCNLRTHQCYPTWQESSLSALMRRLRPFPPLKHDTGDKRHFVCSKNSSTDSLPRDEQQIVLMRKLRKYDERAKQVLLQYSCTVTTSNLLVRFSDTGTLPLSLSVRGFQQGLRLFTSTVKEQILF